MSTAAEIQIRMAAAESQCSGILQALAEEVRQLNAACLHRITFDHLAKSQRRPKGKRARRQAFYNGQKFKKTLSRLLNVPCSIVDQDEGLKAMSDLFNHGMGWLRVVPCGGVQHIPLAIAQKSSTA